MTGRRVLVGAVVAIALVLLVGRWSASLYTDYLWYASLGAMDLWRAKVTTISVMTLASFGVAALFAFLNLYAVRQSVVSLVLPRRLANIEIGEEVPGRYLLGVVLAMSAAVGALLVFPTEEWHSALLARIGRPFGETDYYSDHDLGFFVYTLPLEMAVHVWAVLVVTAVTVLVVALYALTPSLRWERSTLYVSAYVRRHFTMLGAVVLLILAWSYRLSMYRLLAEGSGMNGLFTAVDHTLVMPASLILSVVTLCAAILVAWAGWTGQMRLAIFAVTAVLLLSLLSRTVAPLIARRADDPATRVARESRYVATRLTFTRRAYAVDRISPESLGTGFTLPTDAATKLAVWDGEYLARAAERLRRVRVIGDGASWTAANGELSTLLVERGTEGTADGRDIWGLGRFDAVSVDERGFPVRAARALPSADDVFAGEPAVYDSAPAYGVLSDSLKQLAGVELASTRSRLMYAWSLQNFRLLFGDLPADRPTMVQRRSVRERVRALAPFFVQGGEVLPVVASDSLYWLVELYSSSSHYPLARRFTILGEERGYFQHAATALVHAASGRVRIVATASPDPIAASWIARFPRVFRPLTTLPPQFRAALPPVTDATHIQALAFASSGFRDSLLVIRHFATPDGADSAAAREPGHAILPTMEGVVSLWPLLDSADRVGGIVVGRGGTNRLTSWIPLVSDGRRWGSVVDKLRMADTSLHESSAVRTPLRVAPVAGRAMYVQPTFQLRPGAPPSLLRVSVLSGDSVRIGRSLAEALGTTVPPRVIDAGPQPDLRVRADSLYRVMREALAAGDWVAFGRAFDALGAALRVAPP